jgi:hypothetical protein
VAWIDRNTQTFSNKFEVFEGDNTLKLDVSELNSGVYLMSIQEGNERHTEKVVIER